MAGAKSGKDTTVRKKAAGDKIQATHMEITTGTKELLNDEKAIEQATKVLITSQMRAPYYKVAEGFEELLKRCVLSDLRFSSSSAISGHVDHFESVHEDSGWGCGWRNIQILCSYLVAEDSEARDALFNGVGFVPDIPALQRWLEIAWMKGFDLSGAEYFNWEIYGTKKWIGTTECAALLRSFGVRAMIVSFTAIGGDQSESSVDGLSGAGGGEGKSKERTIGKKKSKQESKLDEASNSVEEANAIEGISNKSPNIECSECGENSSRGGTQTRSIFQKAYQVCIDCVKKLTLSSKLGSGQDADQNSTDAPEETQAGENASKCEDVQREDNEECGNAHWGIQCSNCGDNPIRGARYNSMRDRNTNLCSKCMKATISEHDHEYGVAEDYILVRKLPASRLSPAGEEGEVSRQKSGTETDSKGEDRFIQHHHLTEWVWSYFTGESSYDLTLDRHSSTRHPVIMSNRSPLYFQHRGHSRTIVGIEHRQMCEMSEEVYLLVLDPSQRSEHLAKTLREKTGWKKLVAHSARSLTQPEYQICYAERGIATGEELEGLKVLNSLNYCFYSPKLRRR